MAIVSRPSRLETVWPQIFMDLNSIPKAAIESIEILKDGASTTYGADAVAGVINIKLRHNYRGAEATLSMAIRSTKMAAFTLPTSCLVSAMRRRRSAVSLITIIATRSLTVTVVGFLQAAIPEHNSSPANLQLSRDVVIAAGVDPATLPVDANGVHSLYSLVMRRFSANGFSRGLGLCLFG